MGRITGSRGSQDHSIRDLGGGLYRLSWTVDRKYPGSRLRYPRRCTRDTDLKGARGFAKRWGLVAPGPNSP
jgi:hypothetical protein